MAKLSFSNFIDVAMPSIIPSHPQPNLNGFQIKPERAKTFTTSAFSSGGFSINKAAKSRCGICNGQGAIECPGCKGTGKNKKNGNIFERWKCFDCQGFGLKSCPNCGKGGLTPEQRGER
ncbi:PREDICTED: protein EMBRYO SAC DEVELOPMENT ARREST 3, chloroplastic isoform X1 [Nelumbo nucifera]|uniref:Protein EMBRYO SAC DEVELOPMENT ARREST 3, chloroplastic isoform X1 n=1 Tax=Nelumbo nucifera TaxID=4432 RepID=A0A1U7ZJ61_NELNU|nr:PREDICTED: protein EMBRYO SAC DEVELOPMENT ARREST 3, chloroplastic isoform X1 [Nelumbo nucifera]